MLTGLAKLLFPIIKKSVLNQASNKAVYWLLDQVCDIMIEKKETNHDESFKTKVKHIAKLHR